MISQERSDLLKLMVEQKQRRFKKTFGDLYLGERLNAENQQEPNPDGAGLGSEPGGPPQGEPAVEGPGQHQGGDGTENAVQEEGIV